MLKIKLTVFLLVAVAALSAVASTNAPPVATDVNIWENVWDSPLWFPRTGDVLEDNFTPSWQYKVTAVLPRADGTPMVFFVVWPANRSAVLTIWDWRSLVFGPPPYRVIGRDL